MSRNRLNKELLEALKFKDKDILVQPVNDNLY